MVVSPRNFSTRSRSNVIARRRVCYSGTDKTRYSRERIEEEKHQRLKIARAAQMLAVFKLTH